MPSSENCCESPVNSITFKKGNVELEERNNLPNKADGWNSMYKNAFTEKNTTVFP